MKKEEQIRLTNGPSNYFQGVFATYGRYQWNVKYYGYQSEDEIEYAQFMFLGNYIEHGQGHFKDVVSGFETINQLLDRQIESSLQGRSNGWLVINTDLSIKELEIVDAYIQNSMKLLPKVLKEYRKDQKNEGEL